MHHAHRRTTLAGTALATMALTFSSIGVAAGEAEGIPDAPTGYPELDQALAGELANTKVIVQTQYIEGGGEVFAKTMLLPLMVFLLLQRYFVRGILSGSVKG